MPACYRRTPTGLTLYLRVTPNAGVDKIEGVQLRDNDTVVLRMRVKAVPDKGKANKAVIALLAKQLGIAKTSITLTSGETARLKTLAIAGDPADLAATLAAIIAQKPQSPAV